MIPMKTSLFTVLVLLGFAACGSSSAQTAVVPVETATTHDHAAAGGPTAGAPGRTASPHDASVYLGWPLDGAVIRSAHFKVWFGARNIGVAPAGAVRAGTGHHHLLIDVSLPADMSIPIPSDKNHLHFGAGQTETTLELPPGTHTLQLLMGDAGHVPHDPPVFSRKITVHVQEDAASRASIAHR